MKPAAFYTKWDLEAAQADLWRTMGKPVLAVSFVLTGGDFSLAGDASGRIKRLLQQAGIPAPVVRRAAIAAYEAEMNVIIHADGGTMYLEIHPDETRLVVEDQGGGIENLELAMREGYSTAPDFVREMGFGAGMGLPNMKKCADQFSIVSAVGKGTKIEMVFRHKIEAVK